MDDVRGANRRLAPEREVLRLYSGRIFVIDDLHPPGWIDEFCSEYLSVAICKLALPVYLDVWRLPPLAGGPISTASSGKRAVTCNSPPSA